MGGKKVKSVKFRNVIEVISLQWDVITNLVFYVSQMMNTREKPVVIAQKNTIKKSKHIDTKRHPNTKKNGRIRNKQCWI